MPPHPWIKALFSLRLDASESQVAKLIWAKRVPSALANPGNLLWGSRYPAVARPVNAIAVWCYWRIEG